MGTHLEGFLKARRAGAAPAADGMALTGCVLPYSAAEATSSSTVLNDVAAAVEEHGLVVLPPSDGGQFLLPPKDLMSLVRQLSLATGGKGELMPVISDIENACPPTQPPHCALILTSIRHGTTAATSVAPQYRGKMPISGHIGSPPGRAAVWHQDEQFRERPAHLTALYCVRTPADDLGDTTFADSVKGYARLPTSVQRRIGELRGRHSLAKIPLLDGGDPRCRPDHSVAMHPLVLDPPRGKRCMYIGSLGAEILDSDGTLLEKAEAEALLQTLFASMEESGLYTHRWRVGECLIMDNRRILHTASGRDYSHDERLMVRVQSREPVPYEAIRAKL